MRYKELELPDVIGLEVVGNIERAVLFESGLAAVPADGSGKPFQKYGALFEDGKGVSFFLPRDLRRLGNLISQLYGAVTEGIYQDIPFAKRVLAGYLFLHEYLETAA